MIINKMDHTISSSPASSNCRQTAGYSSKPDVILARRRRTELRRLKVLSNENDSISKRRRPENIGNNNNNDNNHDHDFLCLSSVIGRRREMEDAVRVELGFVNRNSKKFDFYGVYDGHGGSRVAYVCGERLHKLLAEEMNIGNGSKTEMNWEELMVQSFAKMDEEVNETDLVGSMGSTAVVAVVGDEEIVVANCGDSRAVLSRGGTAVPLSNDHKVDIRNIIVCFSPVFKIHAKKKRQIRRTSTATVASQNDKIIGVFFTLTKDLTYCDDIVAPDRPDELERIEHSGGRVIDWNGNRVLGVLATSRSIGDRQLKPYVIAKPEVIVNKRDDKEDEFMILASDGLWDVMSNDFACHIVRKCLDGRICRKRLHQMNGTMKENKYRMTNAAVVLTELAMARGSKDNISVIVVNLKDQISF